MAYIGAIGGVDCEAWSWLDRRAVNTAGLLVPNGRVRARVRQQPEGARSLPLVVGTASGWGCTGSGAAMFSTSGVLACRGHEACLQGTQRWVALALSPR